MKAYNKDSLKMFKNNFFRFISIVLIIVLGTAFYVGMNSISPAMEKKAEKYLRDQNVFDVSVVSNLGYKDEDVEKLEDIDNIVKVVLDGLNKVAYEDDKQVIEVKALKFWDVADYLEIKLTNWQ